MRRQQITGMGLAFCMASAGFAAVPEISSVRLTQPPNTAQAVVSYRLGGVSAVVTVSFATNAPDGTAVAIPETAVQSLTGDVNQLVAAADEDRSFAWNLQADFPEMTLSNLTANVRAWSLASPPPVAVIDLSSGDTASSYPVRWYSNLSLVPGGATNRLYKTTSLILLRLHRGSFCMGTAPFEMVPPNVAETYHRVILSRDFYAGLYEVTQEQWALVTGVNPSTNTSGDDQPATGMTFLQIRGSNDGVLWSATNPTHTVDADSFIGRLRARTGLPGLDLPTEAQWEYACRAGSTAMLPNGITLTNTTEDANLSAIARYAGNGGGSGRTAAVGSYAPNGWGLYDMIGNVWERCLDRNTSATAVLAVDTVTDPVGADGTGRASFRVMRGAACDKAATSCRSSVRYANGDTAVSPNAGLRLFMNLQGKNGRW